MLWIFIGIGLIVLSPLVATWVWWRERDYTYSETLGTNLGIGFFISAIAAIAVGLLGNVISSAFVDSHWEQESSVELVSLADANSTKGRFFLGSGSIENSPVYSYYVRSGQGYVLRWKAASDSTIYQQSGTPRLNTMELVSDNPLLFIGEGTHHYDFVVPPGSIQQVYNLDAQ